MDNSRGFIRMPVVDAFHCNARSLAVKQRCYNRTLGQNVFYIGRWLKAD